MVSGTTVDATLEQDEPFSAAGPIEDSVWFSFSVSWNRELLVALDAAGDMDAAASCSCASALRARGEAADARQGRDPDYRSAR